MRINELISIFSELGCDEFYAKELSENDNSKQQIYLGANFRSINQIPKGPIYTDQNGPRKLVTFKADLDLFWLNEYMQPEPAVKAKLIWYPKYPEVRLSGFLYGCKAAPSEFFQATNRISGRILFLGTDSATGRVYCYLGIPESEITNEFISAEWADTTGVLTNLSRRKKVDPKSELLRRLREIHLSGPISGQILSRGMEIKPYKARNAGGLTLEAMLGIPHNSISEGDFMGWEVKHFSTTDFGKTRGRRITLFTSEPDLGLYNENFIGFMKKYGRTKEGTPRYDFTGQHVAKFRSTSTGLRIHVEGFDFEKNEINEADGRVLLQDSDNHIAAGWSFSRLLDHWERKHASACYVPGIFFKKTNEYAFGNNIILGIETSFLHFITALNYGIIFYDPGNRVSIRGDEHFAEKRRNQFRFSSSFLGGLYKNIEEVNLLKL
ncbi:MvaI/BcnI restriction endonuclease family protein [Robiginitalea myxolifaciens]|uniref:MvaI/BcnI restriction endonuclease family protein n=1 Tax=Robiginitalea myxolifaciens TaxID=400055 RepID=A0A1I6G0V7_9FLAO|nr:MvaI/BcnI family restriction endonuclease [Robiginitalea myxolifaciens]SFR35818.1 MvaI/BcnI restriction endonuclease family protein [Robiginitalea myxolifaciens]